MEGEIHEDTLERGIALRRVDGGPSPGVEEMVEVQSSILYVTHKVLSYFWEFAIE